MYSFQVYYLPIKPVYNQCILPTVFSTFPIVRNILIREKIDLVHGHAVSLPLLICPTLLVYKSRYNALMVLLIYEILSFVKV